MKTKTQTCRLLWHVCADHRFQRKESEPSRFDAGRLLAARKLQRYPEMEQQDHQDAEIVMAKTGERLKAIRNRAGLTQVKFAAQLGVPVRTYGNYERGKRRLPQTVRIAIYRTFGVDPLPADLADLPKPAVAIFTSDEAVERDEALSFWGQLRAETKASLQSKSRTGRFIHATMDRTFAVASGYGWLRCMIVGGEYPACAEPNIADSLFKLSCVLTLLLIIPVTRDLPLIRIGRHLIARNSLATSPKNRRV